MYNSNIIFSLSVLFTISLTNFIICFANINYYIFSSIFFINIHFNIFIRINIHHVFNWFTIFGFIFLNFINIKFASFSNFVWDKFIISVFSTSSYVSFFITIIIVVGINKEFVIQETSFLSTINIVFGSHLICKVRSPISTGFLICLFLIVLVIFIKILSG
uniref:Uncharacterized protein n=1 Tax=Cacopsylla melanoneura TaxID=428564 RepID=A0A8D8TQQ5_9HEMI